MSNIEKSYEEKFKFVEFLQIFLPVVDSRIPTKINDGGCGIFAYHLYNEIDKLGFNPSIKYIGQKKDKADLTEFVTNNRFNDENLGVLHCQVVLSETLCLDSCGLKTPLTLLNRAKKGDIFVGDITPEALKIMNDHVGSWNVVFDRDCEPQIIKELATMSDEWQKFLDGTSDLHFEEKVKYTKKTVAMLKRDKMMDGMGGIGGLLSALSSGKVGGKTMPTFEEFQKARAEGKSYEEISGPTPEGMPTFEEFQKGMAEGKPLGNIFNFDKILEGKKKLENKE